MQNAGMACGWTWHPAEPGKPSDRDLMKSVFADPVEKKCGRHEEPLEPKPLSCLSIVACHHSAVIGHSNQLSASLPTI